MRAQGFGCRAQGFGIEAQGLGCWARRRRMCPHLELWTFWEVWGFGVFGSEIRVCGVGFRQGVFFPWFGVHLDSAIE